MKSDSNLNAGSKKVELQLSIATLGNPKLFVTLKVKWSANFKVCLQGFQTSDYHSPKKRGAQC